MLNVYLVFRAFIMKWRVVENEEVATFLTEKLVTKILSGSDSLLEVMASGGNTDEYRTELIVYLKELYQ
jgi:hypothetical protein